MINLNQIYLVIGFVVLFGLMGSRRGVSRELLTSVGIVLAIIVGRWGTSSLVPWVNKFHKLTMFSLKGGLLADDPTDVFATVNRLPPLIATDSDRLMVGTVAFVLVVLVSYLLAGAFIADPKTTFQRLSGTVLAGVNGYLVAFFLAPRHLPTPETTIRVSTGGVIDLLNRNMIAVVLIFVIILIVLGLHMSTPPKRNN
jgi:hypothetical protein